jgi:glycosyltransferase involved in cell wall biosynthesis
MDYYDNRPVEGPTKQYGGTAYVGVATSDTVTTFRSLISVERIERRPGDSQVWWGAFTKGVESREHHVREFLGGGHDYILFLDGDMWYPPDALERLRSHGLPCVTGLYYRRTLDPHAVPIWYEDDPTFQWPMMPFRGTPHPGRLYRLGGTGFGCWLIHREVFETVAPLLKGEYYVHEDDMDVWPYDLTKVLAGEEQLRPLRGVKTRVGADLRLSFFIRQAGYTIWGDPNVSCGHFTTIPIGHEHWANLSAAVRNDFAERTGYEMGEIRRVHEEAVAEILP